MINKPQVVIGTAGHIDHGKTSIVKLLTGTNTDTLKEEKSRGMTIDIGFAYLNNEITIIDVPGHERFIRNMVAGISTINIALIIVSADDGLMPQTHEHIEILHLLNIKHAIAVITKADKVENNIIDLVESEIKDRIQNTNFYNAKILRTSVKNNVGIDLLKKEIINLSENVGKIDDRGFFYMPIDRVFSKTGFGTIATGTVLSGKLERNSEIIILPEENSVTVRSFQTHGKTTEKIKVGDRAAINFSSVEQAKLKRGSVLAVKNQIAPTSKIIVNIKMIENNNWTIKDKQLVHIHIGTSQVIAKVITFGIKILPGQSANVLLDLNNNISPLCDQRFIVRSISPMETIAGGKVLDNNPKFSKKDLKKNIQKIEIDNSKRFLQSINRFWKKPLSIEGWSKFFNVSKNQILKWVNTNKVLVIDNIIYSSESFNKSKKEIIKKIEEFHKNNKYKKSISKEELLISLEFDKKWLEFVTNEMKSEIVIHESGYGLKNNKIDLSEVDLLIANEIESSLIDSGFDLLSSLKLYDKNQKKALNILYLLKDSEKVVQIDSDLWMHINNHNILKDELGLYFTKHTKLSVPEFKKMISVTRKNAIPILEFCDKIKFTTRVDNYRVKGDNLNAELSSS